MKKRNIFAVLLAMMMVSCSPATSSSATSNSTSSSSTPSSSTSSETPSSTSSNEDISVDSTSSSIVTSSETNTSSSSSSSKASSSSKTGNTNKCTVTFNLNYTGAPAATTVEVEKGKTVAEPTDPTRNGKAFTGWAIAKNSTQIYDFTYPVKKDMTLYATWGETGASKIKGYTFEAEYCPCITDGQGMQGSTYSGGTSGQGLIQEDLDKNADASNNFWVHFLYMRGNTLTFDINSDKAVTNATIYMRLSAEYHGPMIISPDMYTVKLNNSAIEYETVIFPNVPGQGEPALPFNDFLLGTNLSLNAGPNKIEMITNNDIWLYGTAMSTAPMVDCLKFYVPSDTSLTWPNAKLSNIIFLDE